MIVLQGIKGISSVEIKKDIYQIACSRDATPEISRAIVESGVELSYLNKKEYGLDDIYCRYFEGGENHE